jgi:uncharacterized protein (TIGR00725 family)
MNHTNKITIGVMGSAVDKGSEHITDKVKEVGREIARHGCVLVTGACAGLPLDAAEGAKEAGGFVIGMSPAVDWEEHKTKFKYPYEHMDVIIYTGFGVKGRNVLNIRSSDAVVFVGGRVGTLNEFTIAYDSDKIIGILTGTGGISAHIKGIITACEKKSKSKIIYEKEPKRMVERLLKYIEKEHKARHLKHLG